MLRREKSAAPAAAAATGTEESPADPAARPAGKFGTGTQTGPPRTFWARLFDRLRDLPWAKLRPRVPDLKKSFGPFLVVLIAALLVTYAVILHTLSPTTKGSRITINRLYAAAGERRVVKALFEEHDANLLVLLAEPQGTQPAAAAPPAAPPAASPTTVPSATVPPAASPAARWHWLAYPSSDAETGSITDKLLDSGAEVAHDHQNGKKTLRFLAQFLFPLLILAAVFAFFFLLITGTGGSGADFLGFSRFASKVQRRKRGTKGTTTFENVAGNEEAIMELQEVVDYLMNPEQFAELGARAPKGVLLAGPPGTGKTLLAKAVAGEAVVPFVQLSGSEFVESLVGVGAARVRDLFKQARALAPCIIFIDELDAAGRQRGAGVGGGNDEREQTLNQLLVEMDGFSGSLGIAVLGATNRPDILDPALLRPGRFDRQIVIDVPDVRGRTAILEVHTRKRPLAEDADLQQIAKQVPGFTGAELANVINEAALLAVRDHRDQIAQIDLEKAVDRVLAGPERRSHILTPDEKLLIAYHEAGHAVTAHGAGQTTGVLKLSI